MSSGDPWKDLARVVVERTLQAHRPLVQWLEGRALPVLDVMDVSVYRAPSCSIGSVTLGKDGEPLIHINSFRILPSGRILNPCRRGKDGHNYDVVGFAQGRAGADLRRSVWAALRAAAGVDGHKGG